MAGGGFLALLDDMASMMDKVAVMARANAQIIGKTAGPMMDKTGAALSKTSGVVSDDIAVSVESLRVSEAEERIGLMAKRELGIVKKVAMGSARNKIWLSGLAMGLSAGAPWALTGLLALGGLFLCKEGAEKVIHSAKGLLGKGGHSEGEEASEAAPLDPKALKKWEKDKIDGAIRTDMVLSGEIILLSLGMVAGLPLLAQAGSLALVGAAMTVGVYGTVAALVKVDDIGLALKKWGDKKEIPWAQKRGEQLMFAMPYVMRGLTAMGTVAMLAVGGGILAHMIPAAGAALHALEGASPVLGFLGELGLTAGIGLAAGAVVETAAASKPGSWILDKVGDGFSALAKSLAKLGKSLQSAEPSAPKPSLAAEPALASTAALEPPSAKQTNSNEAPGTGAKLEHGRSPAEGPVSRVDQSHKITAVSPEARSKPDASTPPESLPPSVASLPVESAPPIDMGKLAKKAIETMPGAGVDAITPDARRRAP